MSNIARLFFLYFRKLVCDPKVKLKYQHLITNSFVEVRNVHCVSENWTPTAPIHNI